MQKSKKMGCLIISPFKVQKQHKSLEATGAGIKEINQKGAYRFISDEAYIKYMLLRIQS